MYLLQDSLKNSSLSLQKDYKYILKINYEPGVLKNLESILLF